MSKQFFVFEKKNKYSNQPFPKLIKLAPGIVLGLMLLGFALSFPIWVQYAQAHEALGQKEAYNMVKKRIPRQTLGVETITATGGGIVNVGQDITYKVEISADGTLPSTDVVVTNDLSGQIDTSASTFGLISNKTPLPTWTATGTNTKQLVISVVGLRPDEIVTVTFKGKAASPTYNGEPVTNQLTISPNPTSINSNLLTYYIRDLLVDITSATSAQAGQLFLYQVKATHLGTRPLNGVTVTFAIPTYMTYVSSSPTPVDNSSANPVVWTNLNLPTGGTNTQNVLVKVADTLPYLHHYFNSSASIRDGTSVLPAGLYTYPDNNRVKSEAGVNIVASLTSDKTSWGVGLPNAIVYSVPLENKDNPPSSYKGDRDGDNIESAVEFSISTGANVTNVSGCNGGGTSLPRVPSNAVSLLAKGAEKRICQTTLVLVNVPYDLEQVTATAYITYYKSGWELVPPLTKVTNQRVVIVNASPKLTLTETVDKNTPQPGEVIKYTIGVPNQGDQAVKGIVLTKTLPPSITVIGQVVMDSSGNLILNTDYTFTPLPGQNAYRWEINKALPAANALTLMVSGQVTTNVLTGYPVESVVSMSPSYNAPDLSQLPPNGFTATTPVTVSKAPDLVITATGTSSAVAGQAVQYFLDVTNQGYTAATNVTVVYTQPNNTTFSSASPNFTSNAGKVYNWLLGTILPGETRQIVVNLNVVNDSSLPSSSFSITSLASVGDTPTLDPIPSNNNSSFSTSIGVDSGLNLFLNHVPPDNIYLGSYVTYRVRSFNYGGVAINHPLIKFQRPDYTTIISDTISHPLVSYNGAVVTNSTIIGWDIPTIPAYQFEDRYVTVRVDNAINQNIITLTALITGIDGSIVRTSIDSFTLTVPPPVLNISQSVFPQVVQQGDFVTYTIRITNSGPRPPDQASLHIDLSNSLDYVSSYNCPRVAASDYSLSTLSANSVLTCTLVTRVKDVLLAGTTLITSEAALYSRINSQPVTITANSTAISLKQSVVPLLDLVKIPSKNSADKGDTVAYTITVRNKTNSQNQGIGATNIVITDVLPALSEGVSYGYASRIVPFDVITKLEVGEEKSFYLQLSVTGISGTFTNTALMSFAEGPSAITATTTTNIGKFPDLGVTTIATTQTNQVNGREIQTINYQMTVQNVGNKLSNGGSLLTQVPPHTNLVSSSGAIVDGVTLTWTIPTLAIGGSVAQTMVVTVNNPLSASVEFIAQSAKISTTDTPATPSNDESQTKVLLGDNFSPNLVITMTMEVEGKPTQEIRTGDELIYTLYASNIGNQAAGDPILVDFVLDALSTQHVWVKGVGNVCEGSFFTDNEDRATKLVWRVTPELLQKAKRCKILAKVIDNLPVFPAYITATVAITDLALNGTDKITDNNRVITSHTVIPTTGLIAELRSDPPANQYITTGLVTYTLVLTNIGDVPAYNVSVDSVLPNVNSYKAQKQCEGDARTAANVFIWDIRPLPLTAKKVVTCTFVAQDLGQHSVTNLMTAKWCITGCNQTQPNFVQLSVPLMTNYVYQTTTVAFEATPKASYLTGKMTYPFTVTNPGGLNLPVTATFTAYQLSQDILGTHVLTPHHLSAFHVITPGGNWLDSFSLNVLPKDVDFLTATLSVDNGLNHAIIAVPEVITTYVYPVVMLTVTDKLTDVVPRQIMTYTIALSSDQRIENLTLTNTLPASVTFVYSAVNSSLTFGTAEISKNNLIWSGIQLPEKKWEFFTVVVTAADTIPTSRKELINQVQAYAPTMDEEKRVEDLTYIVSPLSVNVIGPGSVSIGDRILFLYIVRNIGPREISLTVKTSTLTGDMPNPSIGDSDRETHFKPEQILIYRAYYTVPADITNPVLLNVFTVTGVQTDGIEVGNVASNNPVQKKETFTSAIPLAPGIPLEPGTIINFKPVFDVQALDQGITSTYRIQLQHVSPSDTSSILSLTLTYNNGITEALSYNGDTELDGYGKGDVWTHTLQNAALTTNIVSVTVNGYSRNGKPLSKTVTIDKLGHIHLPDLLSKFSPGGPAPEIEFSMAEISEVPVGQKTELKLNLKHTNSDKVTVLGYLGVDNWGNSILCEQYKAESTPCSFNYTASPDAPPQLDNWLTINVTYQDENNHIRTFPITYRHAMKVIYKPRLQVELVSYPIVEKDGPMVYVVKVSHAIDSDHSPITGVKVVDISFQGQEIPLVQTSGNSSTGDPYLTWLNDENKSEVWTFQLDAPYTVTTNLSQFPLKIKVTATDRRGQAIRDVEKENGLVVCTPYNYKFSEWGTVNLSTVQSGVSDGRYFINRLGAGFLPASAPLPANSLQYYKLEANMFWQKEGYEYGLVFGQIGKSAQVKPQDPDSWYPFYFFGIDTMGQRYRIQYAISNAGAKKCITNPSDSGCWVKAPQGVINSGPVANRLRVDCTGSNLSVYLNDEANDDPLWSGSITDSCAGMVGLFAQTLPGDNSTALAYFEDYRGCFPKSVLGQRSKTFLNTWEDLPSVK